MGIDGVSTRPWRLRVYRALLRLFPRRFRQQRSGAMERLFLDMYAQRTANGSTPGALFWIHITRDTTWHAMGERLSALGAVLGAQSPSQGISMSTWIYDVRHALRRSLRRPGFTLAVVVTLGLGIGATTSIFSIVNEVILRPLPYPDPDRVVLVGHGGTASSLGMPDAGYLHYSARASTLESLAVYLESSSTVAGTGEPLELGIIRATPSLMQVLGVAPALGRGLTEADAEPGAEPVAVVTHGFWLRHLGGDSEALGKPVLEGTNITVAGILPAGFEFPRPEATVVFGNRFEAPDVFLALRLDPSVARFGNFMYQGIGRLAPGATPESAQEELGLLMLEAAEAFPGAEGRGGFTPEGLREQGYAPVVMTVKDSIVGDIAQVLWILMGAVGIVLFIATANVANLFLVRAETRRDEIAIRRALGAGRGHLVRSFLFESLLLASVGGAIGVVLTSLATRTLLRFAPGDVPGLEQVSIGPPVLVFAATVSLAVGLIFGIAPLLRTSRLAVGAELASGGRAATNTGSRRRGQELLAMTQVGLTLVLLVGCGVLVRTFQNLRDVNPGFEPTNVLTVQLSLGENLVRGAGYDDGPNDAVRSRFMLDLMDRLDDLPGVEAAAFTADLPLDGAEWRDFVEVEGALPDDAAVATKALRVFMGPGYLDAIGARLRTGRELRPEEFADQPRSVIVNHTFAEQRWPGESPLGKRLLQYWSDVDPQTDVWYTVVGVVEDIRETSLMTAAEPTIYLPTIFLPEGGFAMFVSNMVAVLRTSGPPHTHFTAIREAIQASHPELPINNVETLVDLTSRSFQQVTFAMVLLIIAGVVSAALGLVGIYGTVAYVVSQRTREFGLRMALGASARDVKWGVLRSAGKVGASGLVVGLLGALVAGRALESLLFGVATTDPVVILVVVSALFALVLAASFVPAARAAAIDPVEAIRTE